MTFSQLFLVFLELLAVSPMEFGHVLSVFPSKDPTVSIFPTLNVLNLNDYYVIYLKYFSIKN